MLNGQQYRAQLGWAYLNKNIITSGPERKPEEVVSFNEVHYGKNTFTLNGHQILYCIRLIDSKLTLSHFDWE